ncbi:MAG: hypothetical protein ABIT76_02475 [Chthoniobacterales bacterium]
MSIHKDSLFRIFQTDYRTALWRFFENRHDRITGALASEFCDHATLEHLLGIELLQYDGASNEYRLDDRIERFIEDMLGAAEVAHADWLSSLLDDLRKLIDGYSKLAQTSKSDTFFRGILRFLRTCDSRAQRHLEDIKSTVDFDYRAGADYEVKLLKLQWHLERAHSYGGAIGELDDLLKNHAFFQQQGNIEILSLRSRLIRRCDQIGNALIDIYQQIEQYLNRVMRDHERARKLIRLRGLIERHEHLPATNIEEIAATADGPYFRDSRRHTLLAPSVIDERPELFERMLARAGLKNEPRTNRRVEIQEHPLDEMPPVIDWQDVFDSFCKQTDNLFVFLRSLKVEGRLLTEEEVIDGFCAILSNEDWTDGWSNKPFDLAMSDGWQYAVVTSATR